MKTAAAKTELKHCNVFQFSTWRHVRLHYQAFWAMTSCRLIFLLKFRRTLLHPS